MSLNGFGFATWNKAGERTSWGENRTLQLYEEMELTQTNPASFPGSYRAYTNYGPNGLITGDVITPLQNRFLGQQDVSTVMLYPELDHIAKEDFFIAVFSDGSRYPSLITPREYRDFLFNQCPAWSYRILKAGDRIGFNPSSTGAIATTTTIALDCFSNLTSSSFKVLRVKIYIKGEI